MAHKYKVKVKEKRGCLGCGPYMVICIISVYAIVSFIVSLFH